MDINHIKTALFRLDDFCGVNKIEYIVTGTTALAMLGVPADPNDIDIKVFHLKEEQAAKLEELQSLASLGNENYKGTCYTFEVCGVKVNAIVDNTKNYDDILSQNITLHMPDEASVKYHLIGVQLAFLALKDKMKLRRSKDKTYMLDLIKNLLQL